MISQPGLLMIHDDPFGSYDLVAAVDQRHQVRTLADAAQVHLDMTVRGAGGKLLLVDGLAQYIEYCQRHRLIHLVIEPHLKLPEVRVGVHIDITRLLGTHYQHG